MVLPAAGCAVLPPARVDGEHATVRAPTSGIAADVSARTERLIDGIRRILPGTVVPELEVRVESDLQAGNAEAYTVRDVGRDGRTARARIHVGLRSISDDHVLAHELVHALAGPSWSTLPPLLNEGLCETIAAELEPAYVEEVAPWHVAIVALSVGVVVEVFFDGAAGDGETPPPTSVTLAIDSEDRFDLETAYELTTADLHDRGSWGVVRAAYGFGYLIVRSIVSEHGVERLHDLCRRAAREGRPRVAVEDVIALAGLGTRSSPDWAPWVKRHATESTLRVLGRVVARAFGQLLANDYRGAYSGMSGRDFVSAYGGRFRLAGGETSAVLDDIEGVLAALDEHWPAGSD